MPEPSHDKNKNVSGHCQMSPRGPSLAGVPGPEQHPTLSFQDSVEASSHRILTRGFLKKELPG